MRASSRRATSIHSRSKHWNVTKSRRKDYAQNPSANSTGNDVSIYLGNGNGTFAPATPLAVGANPVDVVAADFNHDGNIDLAVADQDSNDVRIYLGNGDGTFSVSPILLGTPLPNGLAAADLNADGLADLVQEMRQARITVSCVGVQGADRNMLQMISEAGDGRLYMVEDIGALPRIFMKETQEAQKSQLVEDLVHVRVAKKVEAIEGTNVESAPALHGYVTTKPKPTSETILISDLGEPILARWRYGADLTSWLGDSTPSKYA